LNIQIEDFSVRILPGNTDTPIYKQRTNFYYTITGLPLNTNKNLITHLKGKACTFDTEIRNWNINMLLLIKKIISFLPNWKNCEQ
jgi:hypothetical protein